MRIITYIYIMVIAVNKPFTARVINSTHKYKLIYTCNVIAEVYIKHKQESCIFFLYEYNMYSIKQKSGVIIYK